MQNNLNKINLFIIGAAKSGTTSFHDYLSQHLEIEMSLIKEPNYFSKDSILKDNLYYKDAPLIESKDDYINLFPDSFNSRIHGESSVSYLFYSDVAEKLFKHNKDAKILIFLRNPVKRAFSHYLMDYSAGYFNHSFSELIRNKSINKEAYQQVVSLGYYYEQLRRYFDVFPREQIKVLITEEIIKDLNKSMIEIEEFLDVNSYENYDFEIKNVYQGTDNKIISLFYRSIKFKSLIRKIINKDIIDKIKNLFLSKKKPQLNDVDHEFLKTLYKSDIDKLSDLLGLDFKKIWN